MSLNLRARTRIILAIAAILPALAIGSLTIYRANTEVQSEVIRGRLAQVRALASSLDQTVQGARHSLELAAAWWADERKVDETISPDSKRVMDRLWRRLHRELPIFRGLSILDVDGKTIYGEPVMAASSLGAHSFGGFVGDVVFDQGTPYVPIVTQARSRTGERVGVLVARLDLSFVADAIAEVPLGTNARLFVLDGQGAAIAHRSQATGTSSTGVIDSVVSAALGRASEGKIRQGGVLSIYRNLLAFQSRRAVPWALILDQPEADAFALARKAASDTTIIAAIVLALVIVLGAALSSRLTRPLHLLAKRADAIAEGLDQPGEHGPLEAPGEIGLLARRLEEMAVKIGERQRLQSALAHEDRLATVGTMAASVAHEINNPLTTILGYSTFLLEDKAEDDPDRASLTLIAEEASRMKGIVSSMLEYSRSEPGKRKSASLPDVLLRVSTLMAPALKKQNVELHIELPDDPLPTVAAAEQSLQQIFVNLIQNSAQAISGGDSSEQVQTSGAKGQIRVLAKREGTTVIATVRDDGPGIQENERSQIFDTFYTTKEVGQGTGLGLAVVKHLVGEFGGQIEVIETTSDTGACMRLVIPCEAS